MSPGTGAEEQQCLKIQSHARDSEQVHHILELGTLCEWVCIAAERTKGKLGFFPLELPQRHKMCIEGCRQEKPIQVQLQGNSQIPV